MILSLIFTDAFCIFTTSVSGSIFIVLSVAILVDYDAVIKLFIDAIQFK